MGIQKMGLSDFHALSFDCYGTLIDWEAGLGLALCEWSDAHALELSRDALIEAYGQFETRVQQQFPGSIYQEIMVRTLRLVASAFDADVTAEEAADFAASVGRWPAFADSSAALQRLKERFKLVILSNVDRGSFYLSQTRLQVEFDAVITAQDVGSYKPHAANFAYLEKRVAEMGISQNRILHVAQSLYHDHEPARAAGLATVWIDRRWDQAGFGATPAPVSEACKANWRFTSMAEFADAICGPRL